MILKKIVRFRPSVIWKKCLHLAVNRSEELNINEDFSHRKPLPRKVELDLGNFSLHPKCRNKLRQIHSEAQLFQESECSTPITIGNADLMNMLLLRTRSQRKSYLKLLKQIELDQASETDKAEYLEKHAYRVSYANSIIPPDIHERMSAFYANNLIHAVSFGQDLVIDLSYNDQMHKLDVVKCANLVREMFVINKSQKDPYHLHFCGISSLGLLNKLQTRIPDIEMTHSLVTITTKSHLELFPSEKLLYLTPDAEEDLNYSYDDVYVIGGLVERRTKKKPLSLEKSEKEGIRKAKLPIYNFHHPDCGDNSKPLKILRLNEMMEILHVMKNTMDWNRAFEEIAPFRFKQKRLVSSTQTNVEMVCE